MKRFVITSDFSPKTIDDQLLWELRNSADTVIVSPNKSDIKCTNKLSRRMKLIFEKAAQYHLNIEVGGWELSNLVPRKYFLFNKELFRMESGERIKPIHFCSTNPDTIRLIQKESRKLFSSFPEINTFHLWPERDKENIWCNCPSCRAFSFAEQNIMAVNAAADVLAEIRPGAMLSYTEIENNTEEKPSIKPRNNMFTISFLKRDSEMGQLLID